LKWLGAGPVQGTGPFDCRHWRQGRGPVRHSLRRDPGGKTRAAAAGEGALHNSVSHVPSWVDAPSRAAARRTRSNGFPKALALLGLARHE